MPSLYLTIPGTRIGLASEHLEIEWPEQRGASTPTRAAHPSQRNVPLSDIESVTVADDVALTTAALTELLTRGIPVFFWPHHRAPVGMALPARRNTSALAAQLDATRNPTMRLAGAKAVVEAKILNMRRVLQRASANRSQAATENDWLSSMATVSRTPESLDSLRGIEGAATARYFETLDAFFPQELPFERRSRRPPHNPANALLSYLYTLLTAEWVGHIHVAGLEPGWGFFHENHDHRPALALDLMEPYRSALCDALALDLLNHRRLKPDDFTPVTGGWHIGAEGRRLVFVAWEERLEREFTHEQTGVRTTLRRTMIDTCLAVRRFCEGGEIFQPFLMN